MVRVIVEMTKKVKKFLGTAAYEIALEKIEKALLILYGLQILLY